MPPPSRSAATAAASRPAAPGTTTTTPRVGAIAGDNPTTSPIAPPPGIGAVPVLASADTPPSRSAEAVPYSAAPRSPSSSTARVLARIATGALGPTPARRAIASISARGLTRGPSRPTRLAARGAVAASAPSPACVRTAFSASRDSQGASDTKKSLHECASASAGESGRLRSGCVQV